MATPHPFIPSSVLTAGGKHLWWLFFSLLLAAAEKPYATSSIQHPAARHQGPAELHRPGLFARRPPHLPQQRQRQPSRSSPSPTARSPPRIPSPCRRPTPRAARRRSPPGWRLSPPTAGALRLRQPLQPLLELDTATGKVLRTFRRRRRALRRRARSASAPTSATGAGAVPARRPHRPRGRGTGARRSRPPHRQRRLGLVIPDSASGPAPGGPKAEILTGLHASALASHPMAAGWSAPTPAPTTSASSTPGPTNRGRDDLGQGKPSDLFGASPNALAFAPDGRTLYVANGTQNAIAVVEFNRPGVPNSQGLIPVGWFPGGWCFDAGAGSSAWPTSRAIAAAQAVPEAPPEPARRASTPTTTRLGVARPAPRRTRPAALSQTSTTTTAANASPRACRPRPNQPPRAIPERIGEPSLIKHVVYVIKENRTYDQVLGMIPAATAIPACASSASDVTPNQHKLVREFVLLDNTYCAGHSERRRPPVEHDRLRHRLPGALLRRLAAQLSRRHGRGRRTTPGLFPAGFIWDNALKHGNPIRNYGEFMACPRALARSRPQGRARLPRLLPDLEGRGRGPLPVTRWWRASGPSPPRTMSAGRWTCRTSTAPISSSANSRSSRRRASSRNGHHLPAQRPHQRHQQGTAPRPPPLVADNDLAFGRIVEASATAGSGRTWPSSPSRTTRRTASTTSAATARPPTSPAPTRSARRRGQHPVQHRQPAAHHGADPRPAAR
jgi:hypothetical protein